MGLGWGWVEAGENHYFKNLSFYKSALFKSPSCAKMAIIRKSGEEEVSSFYDVLLEDLFEISQSVQN